jgi:hypothetical protein
MTQKEMIQLLEAVPYNSSDYNLEVNNVMKERGKREKECLACEEERQMDDQTFWRKMRKRGY